MSAACSSGSSTCCLACGKAVRWSTCRARWAWWAARAICAYVASKHAIIGLTKTAALEQGPRKVRVNACCPGPIAGTMTFKLAEEVFAGSNKTFAETVPLGRHGTPEDVAGLVSYLLSDHSTYATGTTHSVDGGFTTA